MMKLFNFILFIAYSTTAKAQTTDIVPNCKAHFYAGLNIRIATLSSATSIKTLFEIKAGYNLPITKSVFAGPQMEIMFIKSPVNRRSKAEIFIGPSTEIKISEMTNKNRFTLANSKISSRLSWIFPVNPRASDYIYKDNISVNVAYKNSRFYFYNTSLNINLDFQKFDIGFFGRKNRMLSLTTGSSSSFNF